MIGEFLESWGLFQNTYIAACLMVVLLSLVGVLVVGRDQIFIGAAVSKASAFGIALGMWAGTVPILEKFEWVHSEAFLLVLSGVFSVLAALIVSRSSEERGSQEAITGWVFLVSGSVAILVVYHSPHSLEDIHRLLSTSIIGASAGDVWMFAVLTTVVATSIFAFRSRLILVLTDTEMARAVGMKTRAWEMGQSCLLGLTVGVCLHSSGLPYTFGCLVLPVLAARNLCRRPRPVFIVAPLVGLATCIGAFVLAHHYDQPPGQVAVALLCAVVAVTAGWRQVRKAN